MNTLKAVAAVIVTSVFILVGRMGTLPAYAGGASSCVIGVSSGTSEVLCAAAAGTVYAVEFDSPTVGASDVLRVGCFDTGKVGNSVVNITGDGSLSIPKVIAGWVDTTKIQNFVNPLGRNFSNGLSCVKNAALGVARILFKLD